MASVEKFFWSESDATQALIEQYIADRKVAFAAIKEFVAEVGAENMYHSRGECRGVEFKGKTPAGWTSKHKYMRTVPEKKTAEGKALYARMMALRLPVEEDYFIKGTEFEKYWGVIIDGNRFSMPTAAIARQSGKPGRVLIRCHMLPGAAPKPKKDSYSSSDCQHEGGFALPDGYHEWKEWEFLKFCDEFNAQNRINTGAP